MLSTRRLTLDYGPTTRFGSGAIADLPDVVRGLGYSRALLVTDRGIAASGVLETVQQQLAGASITTQVFDGIGPNPSTGMLDEGARVARQSEPAAVVALGGGSVLDASKGIALMAANEGPASAFDYRNEPARPGRPLIAVPTTAGTGSETNSFGVIDNETTHRKMYVGHPSVLPRAVILDPQLTCGLPAGPTVATGMDVLVHALESLSSPSNNPYAEGINLQVIRMVAGHLPRAAGDGNDLEARAQMLLAAHMAGLAFATTGLGIGHAIAHALGARIGAVHGVALAVLLPHVLRFNLPVCAPVYARAAWALGVSKPGAGETGDAEAAIESVRRLALDLNMPRTLRELGFDETLIPTLIPDVLEDEVIANTPRLPSPDELEFLLHAALSQNIGLQAAK
jgi:alcohol dehydrogenase class IV